MNTRTLDTIMAPVAEMPLIEQVDFATELLYVVVQQKDPWEAYQKIAAPLVRNSRFTEADLRYIYNRMYFQMDPLVGGLN